MFADGIQAQVKRSNTKTTWRNVVRTLATEPVDDITDFGKVVEQSLATVSNRSLFVIVSDFLVPTDTVRAGLARLRHRRHDVMLMQVLDRQELRFDLDEPSPFEGLEGEGRVNIDPRVIREDYLAALTDHCNTLEKTARSLGFDYLRLDSHGSVGPALAAMLGRRALLARGGRAG
jgi:uncharacterized protein (DUF58 family)